MADKKRNTTKVKKELKDPVQTSNQIQVTNENVHLVSVKMLEAINKNLGVIQQLLTEIKNK